ncbi:MAG: DUF1624 domain-containing protein [Blastocatellia bacterium]|nr:DUF1624 domain-containing protein [Blastocatellia bacterium]
MKSKRIVSLDLLRALAVVMMVQGHTIDVLLADEYRSYDYLCFSLWQFGRGMTAPIFLLTSGTVFTYLLQSASAPLCSNPRLSKGIKRAFLLIGLGYLLRFPAQSISGLFYAPAEQWHTFCIVDVLQLIGVGMLLLLCATFISEKLRLNDLAVYGLGALFFFICAPFAEQIDWNRLLLAPVAAYFYSRTGSLFPLFPWVGYVMFGGVLGGYLAGRRFEPARLGRKLAAAGMALLALYYYAEHLKAAGYGPAHFWLSSPDLVLLRLGSALLLLVPVVLLSARSRTAPRMLVALGRSSLPIYLLHLVILYGSPWNSGLNKYCDKCLTLWPALSAALLMLTAMIGLAVFFSRLALDEIWAELRLHELSGRPQPDQEEASFVSQGRQ